MRSMLDLPAGTGGKSHPGVSGIEGEGLGRVCERYRAFRWGVQRLACQQDVPEAALETEVLTHHEHEDTRSNHPYSCLIGLARRVQLGHEEREAGKV